MTIKVGNRLRPTHFCIPNKPIKKEQIEYGRPVWIKANIGRGDISEVCFCNGHVEVLIRHGDGPYYIQTDIHNIYERELG